MRFFVCFQVRCDVHGGMNDIPPCWTLFLHEDIIARTLAYKLDLKTYRLNEIEVGREDTGRPTYKEVFGASWIPLPSLLLSSPNQGCRWHCAPNMDPIFFIPMVTVYRPEDCPGVEPYSAHQFPLINTLLSIPFSLLHTLPRLTSMAPSSKYHGDLVVMGREILSL